MEKEFYPVYSVNVCFEDYEMYYVLVGAESEEDLIEHIFDVFPDTVRPLNENDLWALKDDEQVQKKLLGSNANSTITVLEEGLYIKDGMVHEPYFTDKQLKVLCDKKYHRIEEVKGMFTFEPYKILMSYCHG
ncbi:MAG: hypothetical protein VZR53_17130 [Prevotella sp.]|nr:hypothetical protein [Prevotella sp.]